MPKLEFKEDVCKGCGLCASVCPKKILKINSSKINEKGYNPIMCVDMESCISCAFCATICPDSVIEVYK